jgi:hypothetical protein
MRLTQEALEEFEKLWMGDHPDIALSKEELLVKATQVMTAVQILWHPIPRVSATSPMHQ